MAARQTASQTPGEGQAIAGRILRLGAWIVLVAVALQTVAHLANAFVLGGDVANLNADVEGNATTWATVVTTFAAGLAAILHAVAFPELRRSFAALGTLLVWFSFDDAIVVHERVATTLGEDVFDLRQHVAVRLWIIIFLPLLAFAALMLWQIGKRAWPPARRFVLAGVALLIASIAAEALGLVTRPLAEDDGIEWPDRLRTGVEEGLELAGWGCIAVGLLAVLALALTTGAGVTKSSDGTT